MKTHLKFTIASSPGHYQAAQRLIRQEGIVEQQKLTFPTIMAWDDDGLVGVVGTRISDGMILAGPLVVRTDQRRLFTILRLCEAYEASMRSIGISSYILSVERGTILHRGMARYFPEIKPYASEGGYDFYLWKVKEYGWRSQGTPADTGREGPSAQPS